MRITMNSMMRQYNGRLNKVLNNLNAANERVITGRRFTKASQDPASAVQAYQLRREYLKTEDYINNVEHVQSTMDSVEANLMKFSKVAEDAYVDILTAVNGTNSIGERKIIAEELRQLQKSVVMDANSQFGGAYIFGGTSTKELPFKLDDKGVLTFRGIDVNTKDPIEMKKLQDLSKETMYVDTGFGLEVDASGNVVDGSAFNMATPGINALGFGQTADGVPKNLVNLLGEIANKLEQDPLDEADLQKYTKQLDSQRNTLVVSLTQMGTKTKFLDSTKNKLEKNLDSFNKKIKDVEFVDLDKAITDFIEQDYVYKATLKMGTNILSPSFIDFMR